VVSLLSFSCSQFPIAIPAFSLSHHHRAISEFDFATIRNIYWFA
jgi:hypothetical protein